MKKPTYEELVQGLKYARRFLKPIDHGTAYVDDLITRAESAPPARYWTIIEDNYDRFWKQENGEMFFRLKDGPWRESVYRSVEALMEVEDPEDPTPTETTAEVAEPK